MIDVTLQRLYIRGTAVPMSATLLATYMLILHQTFCTYNEGLIKAGTHHPLSEKDVHHLTKLYNTILKLFREMPTEGERNYINEVNNIRTYIARIRSTISNYIDAEHINEYLPKDSYQKDRYQITIDPSRIYIREGVKTYLLKDYPLWEKV